MFLADIIEEDGFGNKLIEKFFKERIEPFNEKIIKENEFDSKVM